MQKGKQTPAGRGPGPAQSASPTGSYKPTGHGSPFLHSQPQPHTIRNVSYHVVSLRFLRLGGWGWHRRLHPKYPTRICTGKYTAPAYLQHHNLCKNNNNNNNNLVNNTAIRDSPGTDLQVNSHFVCLKDYNKNFA